MAKVACIDYSLRQPAICIGDLNKPYYHYCTFYYTGKVAYTNFVPIKWCLETSGLCIDRFERHVTAIKSVLGKHNIRKVYIEGLAYRANNFQFSQAMGTQYVTERLQQLGFEVTVVGINTIKKQFSGKGNASKAQMRQHFKNCKLTIPVPLQYHSDIIDAYSIFHAVTKELNGGEHFFKDKRCK